MGGAAVTAQRVPHGRGRHMAQVDQHAEPVHLAHDLLAEPGKPARPRLVGRGVRPRHVVVVGKRHIPDAERVQHAQRAERAVDRVAAFRAEQRGDPPAAAARATSLAERARANTAG